MSVSILVFHLTILLHKASKQEKFKHGLVAGSRCYHAIVKADTPKICPIVQIVQEAKFCLLPWQNPNHLQQNDMMQGLPIWSPYQ